MNIPTTGSKPKDGYLFGPRQAWFAFAMTIGLMLFDYIDRQVIVSLFPYMKADWGLSDKQLGALVSVLSIVLAACALPVSLVADRVSRVKSIVTMATVWSIASISCMFTRNYSSLLAARAVVGVGEAGYGAVGAALIATHFPDRMRSALLGSFMAAASVGSVLGVALGGVIAARWGWQAAFGVVGIPGLVLSPALHQGARLPHGQRRYASPGRHALSCRRRPCGLRGTEAVADASVGVHRERIATHRPVGDVGLAAEFPESCAWDRA